MVSLVPIPAQHQRTKLRQTLRAVANMRNLRVIQELLATRGDFEHAFDSNVSILRHPASKERPNAIPRTGLQPPSFILSWNGS